MIPCHRFSLLFVAAFMACSTAPDYPPVSSEYGEGRAFDARWESLRPIFREAAQRHSEDVGLLVFRSDGTLLFADFPGNLSENHAIPVASASKWISAAVMLRLVDRGVISLDAKASKFLKDDISGKAWAGPAGNITLRHTLSFQTGLFRDADCQGNTDLSLGQCVQEIYAQYQAQGLDHPVGTVFDYGGTHMTVGGRMAERASGKSWHELYDTEFRDFFAVEAESVYYTKVWPSRVKSSTNARIAGGLSISMHDYAQFLHAVANEGRARDGRRYLSARLVREMLRDHVEGGDTIGYSPADRLGRDAYHYALGNWVERENGRVVRNSSPGLFGYYPWIDHEYGYYAVFGAYLGLRGSPKAYEIVETVRPAIQERMRVP